MSEAVGPCNLLISCRPVVPLPISGNTGLAAMRRDGALEQASIWPSVPPATRTVAERAKKT